MANLLKGIPVLLNCDHLISPKSVTAKTKLIFTGPIDEYFGFKLGRLRYRGQGRQHVYYPNATLKQAVAQVNYPSARQGRRIRTIEWKHLLPREQGTRIKGTVVTTETPFTPSNPGEFEYPFPDQASRTLFMQYEKLASASPKLLICGRLGEYRYYDMDQAIGRALMIARQLTAGRS
jgi:UDP-galactopyranose mutase